MYGLPGHRLDETNDYFCGKKLWEDDKWFGEYTGLKKWRALHYSDVKSLLSMARRVSIVFCCRTNAVVNKI
jgi:hypothetical protein